MGPEYKNKVSVWPTHNPLSRCKRNTVIYKRPSVVDFLDTLDHDGFEEALIHLQNDLVSICILEQENQEARTKRREEFLDFEDAVNDIHGNHGRIHLSEIATRAVREQIASEADQKVQWSFSNPADQASMLWRCDYNDDPTTWGPSRYAILSGLADYRISSTRGRERLESASPVSNKKKYIRHKVLLNSFNIRRSRWAISRKLSNPKRSGSPWKLSKGLKRLALTS